MTRYIRNNNDPDTPDNGLGYTMWVDEDVAGSDMTNYGEVAWAIEPAQTIAAAVLADAIREPLLDAYRDGDLPYDVTASLDALTGTDVDRVERLLGELDPDDIVDTAGAYDMPDLMAWLYETMGEAMDLDNTAIETSNGLVTYNSAGAYRRDI